MKVVKVAGRNPGILSFRPDYAQFRRKAGPGTAPLDNLVAASARERPCMLDIRRVNRGSAFSSIPFRSQLVNAHELCPQLRATSGTAARGIRYNRTHGGLSPVRPQFVMGDSPVRVHLHLVSDSTGETVTTVARACVAQFEGVVPVEHVWSFVRSRAQVDQVLSMVKALPGVVIFTLLSPDLRQALYDGCRALNIPCVAVLDGVVAALSSLLGAESRPAIGRQHALDAGYFSRIDAMSFMLRHDDGQCADELEQADVVLVGRVAHLEDADLDLPRQSRRQGRERAGRARLSLAGGTGSPDRAARGRPDDQPGAAGADPDEPAAAAAPGKRHQSRRLRSRATTRSSSGCGRSSCMRAGCSSGTAGR